MSDSSKFETCLDLVELDMNALGTVHGGCDEHEAPAAPAASGGNFRDISHLQRTLASFGFDPGGVDGKMGRKTRAAIKAFQTQARIKVDGIVGRQTTGALTARLGQK
jgi:peptidoglycan hydrolase-like protein with peptidoglycan-binding domain